MCTQSGQTLFCIIINDSHLTTDHAYNHNNKNRNNLSKYRCNYHSLCFTFLFNCPFFSTHIILHTDITGQQADQHLHVDDVNETLQIRSALKSYCTLQIARECGSSRAQTLFAHNISTRFDIFFNHIYIN